MSFAKGLGNKKNSDTYSGVYCAVLGKNQIDPGAFAWKDPPRYSE